VLAELHIKRQQFTSQLWQDLFKSLNVKLRFSSAYHLQTDGQSERVNQCLENYLRCMVFQCLKKWHSQLSTTEWWYNTSFHTSLKMTPFQILYGFPPPMITEGIIPDSMVNDARDMMKNIKHNLMTAQEIMKKYGDKKRSERELAVGDMAYLKMQPDMHSSLQLHNKMKMHSRFYGPFKVLQRIGQVAYKLLLPDNCSIHPVFHISQLKKHIGPKEIPEADLPLIDSEGNIKMFPDKLLERRMIPRNNEPVVDPLGKPTTCCCELGGCGFHQPSLSGICPLRARI
jgi:hypothetical protein